MKTIKAMAALIVLPMGLGGCATVINGTSQDVQVASQPSGATVEFTGGIGCTAPCELSLKTDEAVLLGKEGEVVSTVAEHNYKVRDDVEKSLMKRGLMTSTDKPVMIVTEEEAALIQAKANSEETVDSQENELPSEAVAEESENEPDGSQPE